MGLFSDVIADARPRRPSDRAHGMAEVLATTPRPASPRDHAFPAQLEPAVGAEGLPTTEPQVNGIDADPWGDQGVHNMGHDPVRRPASDAQAGGPIVSEHPASDPTIGDSAEPVLEMSVYPSMPEQSSPRTVQHSDTPGVHADGLDLGTEWGHSIAEASSVSGTSRRSGDTVSSDVSYGPQSPQDEPGLGVVTNPDALNQAGSAETLSDQGPRPSQPKMPGQGHRHTTPQDGSPTRAPDQPSTSPETQNGLGRQGPLPALEVTTETARQAFETRPGNAQVVAASPYEDVPNAHGDTPPAEDESETSPNRAPPLTPALGNCSMRCSRLLAPGAVLPPTSCRRTSGVRAVVSPRGEGDQERLRRVFSR